MAQAPSPRRVLALTSAALCALAWLATTAVAVDYVRRYAQRFPFADDWDMTVDVLARLRPLTLGWLWSQYNEHRLLLPRLTWVALGRIDGGDFRAPVLLNVAALATAAAAFIAAAWRRRGAASPSDCFFPFMLLHLLQSSVFWGAQWQFVSSTFFFCLIVAIALAVPTPGPRALAAIVALALLLPLCGGNGLTLTPPIAAWLVAYGVRCRRRGQPRAAAWAFGGAGALAALAVVWLIGWHPVERGWAQPTLAAAVVVAGHFIAAGLGPDVARLWPAGGLLVGALLAGSAWLLARATLRHRGDGSAPLLLALWTSLALLAATVGWGRAGRVGWDLFLEYHYAPLALPMLCIVYVTSLAAGPRRLGAAIRWTLCLLAGLQYWHALPTGVHPHVAEMEAFAADLAAGTQAHDLVARHIHLLASSDTPDERATIERDLQALLDTGYYGPR